MGRGKGAAWEVRQNKYTERGGGERSTSCMKASQIPKEIPWGRF